MRSRVCWRSWSFSAPTGLPDMCQSDGLIDELEGLGVVPRLKDFGDGAADGAVVPRTVFAFEEYLGELGRW